MTVDQPTLFDVRKYKGVLPQTYQLAPPTAEQTILQSLPAYRTYLEAGSFSKYTPADFSSDVNKFGLFVRHKPLRDIQPMDIQSWIGILKKYMAPKTVSRKLSALTNYFAWLEEQQILGANPMKTIHFPLIGIASNQQAKGILTKMYIPSGSHGILAGISREPRMQPEERMVNESRRHPRVVPQAWAHRPFVSLPRNERLRHGFPGHPAPFAGGSCRSRQAAPVSETPSSDSLPNRSGLPVPPRHGESPHDRQKDARFHRFPVVQLASFSPLSHNFIRLAFGQSRYAFLLPGMGTREREIDHSMSKIKQMRRVPLTSGDTLIDTIPQLVWVKRPDGLPDYFNQRVRDYAGVILEQIQSDGWDPLQFIHPDDQEGHRMHWEYALDTGTRFEYEERLKQCQTGEYRWFLLRAEPSRNEAGQIVKWVGTCTDIDEQKRMEAALQEGQERAEALMKSKIIGIFVCEGEQILDANDTFLRMTGYTREDLCAGRLNWMQMTPPEYLARTRQAQQELTTQQGLTPYEKEYICQDGCRLPVLMCGVLLQQHPFKAIRFVLDNSARKELEQRKDDFISMASHELKTPLTAVKIQTQLVRKRLAKHAHYEEVTALSRVEGPVKQLERLIADLLDVSKIQAGRLEYVWEPVDLDELLREVTETMQHTSSSHTILVHGSVQASLIGDRGRLGQVLTNLLSNAIKYSPDAETVEMDLSTSEETVTIRVTDHGIGIPRGQCDQIFERFYRADVPKLRAIPGLGMGLYIVAEIVKGQGGTITVDSEVGKGSTFMVTLPRTHDA